MTFQKSSRGKIGLYIFFNKEKTLLGELWQYVKVPVTWTDSGSDSQTMGVTGYVMSGGTTYDHRSSPFGDLASYYEWDSLDPSFGHSDEAKQYHYHAVSTKVILVLREVA